MPLLLGVLIYAVMRIWQMGIAAMQWQADEMRIPIDDIVAQITRGDVSRVPDDSETSARRRRRIHAPVLSRCHRLSRGRDAYLRTAELLLGGSWRIPKETP